MGQLDGMKEFDYDPDADTAFSLPAWRVENTLYFNAQ